MTNYFASLPNATNVTRSFSEMLVALLLDYQCAGPYLTADQVATWDQATCEAAQFCNVNGCLIGSSPTCNNGARSLYTAGRSLVSHFLCLQLASCIFGNYYCADCRGENGDVCLGGSRTQCVVSDPVYRDKESCLSLPHHSFDPKTSSCQDVNLKNAYVCLESCGRASPPPCYCCHLWVFIHSHLQQRLSTALNSPSSMHAHPFAGRSVTGTSMARVPYRGLRRTWSLATPTTRL